MDVIAVGMQMDWVIESMIEWVDGWTAVYLFVVVGVWWNSGETDRQTLLAADNVQLSSLFNLGVAR